MMIYNLGRRKWTIFLFGCLTEYGLYILSLSLRKKTEWVSFFRNKIGKSDHKQTDRQIWLVQHFHYYEKKILEK